jgi:hypothetical protein
MAQLHGERLRLLFFERLASAPAVIAGRAATHSRPYRALGSLSAIGL